MIQAERKAASINKALELAASLATNSPVQIALLEGLAGKSMDPKKNKGTTPAKPVQLAAEPVALTQLTSMANANSRPLLTLITQQLNWPGKPSTAPARDPVKPLTDSERALFEKGRTVYNTICFACHQASGLGLPGLAPTLVGSDWVTGPADKLIRIVTQGLTGPIEVNGTKWQLEMPAVTHLSDEELAAVLTYVRREWENEGTPVTQTDIAATRAKINGRTTAWTAIELQKPLK
jgi:mono/diheme cytochrome c family protein